MKNFLIVSLILMILTCSGCLAPTKQVNYVVVKDGNPLQVLGDKDGNTGKVVVKSIDLKSQEVGNQDISGWKAMPPEHWESIKGKLEGVKKYENDNKVYIQPIIAPTP